MRVIRYDPLPPITFTVEVTIEEFVRTKLTGTFSTQLQFWIYNYVNSHSLWLDYQRVPDALKVVRFIKDPPLMLLDVQAE